MLCWMKYKQSTYKAMLIRDYQVFDHIISPKKWTFNAWKTKSNQGQIEK